MDKKHRTVLILRYFNDLPYSEIADVLNIPLGTVKSRLNQALVCLKERMAPESEMVYRWRWIWTARKRTSCLLPTLMVK